MAAVVIVGVQPAGKLAATFGVAGVEAGVGPFFGQGAVESLYFAVGLGPIGSGAAMFDVTKGVSEKRGSGSRSRCRSTLFER